MNHRIVERTLRPVSPLTGHVRLRAVYFVETVFSLGLPNRIGGRLSHWKATLRPGGRRFRPIAARSDLVCELCVPLVWLSTVQGSPIRLVDGCRQGLPWPSFRRAGVPRVREEAVIFLRPQIERDPPAELKHINKRRKRNQQGFP